MSVKKGLWAVWLANTAIQKEKAAMILSSGAFDMYDGTFFSFNGDIDFAADGNWFTIIPLIILAVDLLYADLKKEKGELERVPHGH